MKYITKTITIFSIAPLLSLLSLAVYARSPQTIIAQNTSETMTMEEAAQKYLGAMNLAQLDYFLKYSRFATKIEDLGIGIPSESNSYQYHIDAQGDEIRKIIMTAKANDSSMKSYTSVVLLFSIGESRTAIAGICETIKPSIYPPIMPIAPPYPSIGILCPDGSHALVKFDRKMTF